MPDSKPPHPADRDANPAGQQTIDKLIDEMGAESFPASDPPAWGAVSSRLDQARRDAEES